MPNSGSLILRPDFINLRAFRLAPQDGRFGAVSPGKRERYWHLAPNLACGSLPGHFLASHGSITGRMDHPSIALCSIGLGRLGCLGHLMNESAHGLFTSQFPPCPTAGHQHSTCNILPGTTDGSRPRPGISGQCCIHRLLLLPVPRSDLERHDGTTRRAVAACRLVRQATDLSLSALSNPQGWHESPQLSSPAGPSSLHSRTDWACSSMSLAVTLAGS